MPIYFQLEQWARAGERASHVEIAPLELRSLRRDLFTPSRLIKTDKSVFNIYIVDNTLAIIETQGFPEACYQWLTARPSGQ